MITFKQRLPNFVDGDPVVIKGSKEDLLNHEFIKRKFEYKDSDLMYHDLRSPNGDFKGRLILKNKIDGSLFLIGYITENIGLPIHKTQNQDTYKKVILSEEEKKVIEDRVNKKTKN